MKNWKKYEMYTDKIRTGILNVNTSAYKKAVSLSVAGIIAVTTLTGCSLTKSTKNTVIETKITEVTFDDLDTEIETKFNFIDDCLNSSISSYPLQQMILTPYKEAKNIEFDLNAENNEYAMFYTEDELNVKKTNIISHLDNSISIIERYTSRNFNEEYSSSKTK